MNLSSCQLTNEERSVLNLGLGFVVTPHDNAFQTRIDLYKLFRLLKLRAFFGTQPQTSDSKNRFKPKSQFTPCIQYEDIAVFERLVLRDVGAIESRGYHHTHDLSYSEKRALDALANDQSIADKGGAVVAMDKVDYMEEVNRQLQDLEFYEPLNEDPTRHLQ